MGFVPKVENVADDRQRRRPRREAGCAGFQVSQTEFEETKSCAHIGKQKQKCYEIHGVVLLSVLPSLIIGFSLIFSGVGNTRIVFMNKIIFTSFSASGAMTVEI